jgi:hypothetical protein
VLIRWRSCAPLSGRTSNPIHLSKGAGATELHRRPFIRPCHTSRRCADRRRDHGERPRQSAGRPIRRASKSTKTLSMSRKFWARLREKSSAGKAAMSDSETIQWVATAVVIAALGTPAGAADLLPPLSARHLPHRPQGHLLTVPQGHLPGASIALPRGERAESAIVGRGANSTFMQCRLLPALRLSGRLRRPASLGGRPAPALLRDRGAA